MTTRTTIYFVFNFLTAVIVSAQSEFSYFNQGSQLYQKGEYKKSIGSFRKAVAQDDRAVFSWYNMGHALVQLKKYHLAVVAYNRAVELEPSWAPPYRLLGDLFYTMGVYPEALAYYRHAEELGESGKYLSLARAEAAYRIGAHVEALKFFEEGLKYDPEDVQIYYAISEIYELEKDYEMARSTLQEALKLAPASGADLYFYLASLYEAEGLKLKALKSLESGLALDPNRHNMRRFLASKYLQLEKPWMAIFILEEGIERDGPASFAIDLADIFTTQKRYVDALKAYKYAHQKGDYRGLRGMKNMAVYFAQAGQTEMSQKVLSQIE